MEKDIYLATPDESGWFFFKKNNKSEALVVFVTEDGVANAMSSSGDAFELDDLIGKWMPIDPEDI